MNALLKPFKYKIFIFLFFISLFNSQKGLSQKHFLYRKCERNRIGFSLQIYPAGIIGMINTQLSLQKERIVIFRFGGNFANRKTFSPYNDFERGGGFGGSIGYQKYFKLKKGKIMAGINTDIWNLWIHWENNLTTNNATKGNTY